MRSINNNHRGEMHGETLLKCCQGLASLLIYTAWSHSRRQQSQLALTTYYIQNTFIWYCLFNVSYGSSVCVRVRVCVCVLQKWYRSQLIIFHCDSAICENTNIMTLSHSTPQTTDKGREMLLSHFLSISLALFLSLSSSTYPFLSLHLIPWLTGVLQQERECVHCVVEALH